MEVVGEADSIDQAVDALGQSNVDVVLMDVDEATAESVDDMRRLRDEMSDDGALVVFARKEDDEGLYRAVVGGAAGLVGENAQPEDLVATIEQAADGEDPISKSLQDRPEVGRRVLETYAELSSRGPFRRPPKLQRARAGHPDAGGTGADQSADRQVDRRQRAHGEERHIADPGPAGATPPHRSGRVRHSQRVDHGAVDRNIGRREPRRPICETWYLAPAWGWPTSPLIADPWTIESLGGSPAR